MSITKSSSSLLIVGLVIGAVAANLASPGAARAEAPRTAVCTASIPTLKTDQWGDAVGRWVSEQLAAGRTSLIVIPEPRAPGVSTICAW